MAKLPDHIDKNDKAAVADYFIKERKFNEYKSRLDETIEREGKGYTFIYGQPHMPYIDRMVSMGYTFEVAGHITWKLTSPPTQEQNDD